MQNYICKIRSDSGRVENENKKTEDIEMWRRICSKYSMYVYENLTKLMILRKGQVGIEWANVKGIGIRHDKEREYSEYIMYGILIDQT